MSANEDSLILHDVIILNIPDIIQDCREQLSQSWIFTIDVEFIIQNMFCCFNDVSNVEINLRNFLAWLDLEGFETKAENTRLQKQFAIDVINKTSQLIYEYLVNHGYLLKEYFPYEYKRLCSDNCVVLTRIGNH